MKSPQETLTYLSLLGAVAPVFVIVAIGFAIRRLGLLTAEADRSLLRLAVNVLVPCLIADSILANAALRQTGNFLLPPLVGLATVSLGYLVGAFGARAMRLAPGKQTRTFAYTVGLYNYGYLAIPLTQSLFDRETVGVLFTHNLGVEIGFWLGASLVLAAASASRNWRSIFNAPVIAILVSLTLNGINAQEWLPPFVLSAARSLGQSAIPLSLLLTGATLRDLLAQIEPRGGLLVAAGASFLRLGLLPLLFLALAKFLPCSVELKRVIVIQAAMPAAMLPVVIVKHYQGDAPTALTVVLVTTLLGLLTIPFWIRTGMVFVGL